MGEAVPVRNIKAKTTCEVLMRIFWVPRIICTDQGTNFTAELTEAFKDAGDSSKIRYSGHPRNARDLLLKSAVARFISVLDLTKGYWQNPYEGWAKPLTAFVTHSGHYQWKVMPFGMKNAGSTFEVHGQCSTLASEILPLIYR
ncbi:retrovirus-related Pol polyprotein from transposon opus [Trichonephila clavipes]|nr:retrovirus-related Pol polyprotein from transposon opus [Trichonephila clavipes]